MSTKIYTAYRVPVGRLNEFLDIFDRETGKVVLKHVRLIMRAVQEDVVLKKIADWDVKKKITKAMKWRARFSIIDNEFLKASKETRDGSAFVVAVGVNIWICGRKAYIIPWGHERWYYKIKYPRWVEDFAYWNNTDEPEGMTRTEWKARERMWDKVCLEKVSFWNRRRMIHHSFDTRDDYVNSIMAIRELLKI